MNKQQEDSRVLARTGARFLTEDEMKQVTGGFNTSRCTIVNCTPDGDCPPIGCPPA